MLRRIEGNALVEFAFVAPILVFILIATVVLGLTVNAKIVVNGAAREAGRTFAINRDLNQARERARDAVVGGGLPEEFQGRQLFRREADVQIRQDGEYVYVTVQYRQPMFIPMLPKLLDAGANPWKPYLDLVSTAVFRMEWE